MNPSRTYTERLTLPRRHLPPAPRSESAAASSSASTAADSRSAPADAMFRGRKVNTPAAPRPPCPGRRVRNRRRHRAPVGRLRIAGPQADHERRLRGARRPARARRRALDRLGSRRGQAGVAAPEVVAATAPADRREVRCRSSWWRRSSLPSGCSRRSSSAACHRRSAHAERATSSSGKIHVPFRLRPSRRSAVSWAGADTPGTPGVTRVIRLECRMVTPPAAARSASRGARRSAVHCGWSTSSGG